VYDADYRFLEDVERHTSQAATERFGWREGCQNRQQVSVSVCLSLFLSVLSLSVRLDCSRYTWLMMLQPPIWMSWWHSVRKMKFDWFYYLHHLLVCMAVYYDYHYSSFAGYWKHICLTRDCSAQWLLDFWVLYKCTYLFLSYLLTVHNCLHVMENRKMAAKRVLSYRSWMSGSVFRTLQTSV